MVKRISRCAILVFLFLSSPLHAEFGQKGTLSATPHPERTGPSAWSLYAGPAILKSSVGIGLGVNYALQEPWGLEVGAVVPHPVHDYAHDSSEAAGTSNSESVSARIRSYGDVHILGLYTLAETPRLVLAAGGGLALGMITNEYVLTTTNGPDPAIITTRSSHRVLPAPRVQAVLRAAITPRLSARLAVSYTYYANSDSLDTRSYSLSLWGMMIEPGVVWKF